MRTYSTARDSLAAGSGADKPEALHAHAARVVEDWKMAHGKPMLSPAAAHDLAARIVDAMVWARGYSKQVGSRADADLVSGSEANDQ